MYRCRHTSSRRETASDSALIPASSSSMEGDQSNLPSEIYGTKVYLSKVLQGTICISGRQRQTLLMNLLCQPEHAVSKTLLSANMNCGSIPSGSSCHANNVCAFVQVFLNLHGYTYVRLDGTTKPEQRQILMQRYNTNPKLFIFILSTRSGGVGMNLTGADTVIFYDSDWNPAMDAQVGRSFIQLSHAP